jgi:hypothetical protein
MVWVSRRRNEKRTQRDVERVPSTSEVVAELRRLADSIETWEGIHLPA